MTLSRLELRSTRFHFASYNVNDLLADCIDSMRPMADKKHVALTLRPAPEAAEIFCDSEAVHQVMSNLLDNALKYTPGERLRYRRGGIRGWRPGDGGARRAGYRDGIPPKICQGSSNVSIGWTRLARANLEAPDLGSRSSSILRVRRAAQSAWKARSAKDLASCSRCRSTTWAFTKTAPFSPSSPARQNHDLIAHKP